MPPTGRGGGGGGVVVVVMGRQRRLLLIMWLCLNILKSIALRAGGGGGLLPLPMLMDLSGAYAISEHFTIELNTQMYLNK